MSKELIVLRQSERRNIMANGYETYNLIEINKIISEATQLEMWDTRENQEKWEVILNMQTRFYMICLE